MWRGLFILLARFIKLKMKMLFGNFFKEIRSLNWLMLAKNGSVEGFLVRGFRKERSVLELILFRENKKDFLLLYLKKNE